MRIISTLLTLIVVTTLLLTSCNDEPAIVAPIKYGLRANFGENFDSKSIQGITVTLTSTTTADLNYTVNTNNIGTADFEAINPGTYNITATVSFTKAEYLKFFGITTNQDKVTFNGALENIEINDINKEDVTVVLKTSKIGNLLLKQIYYAGSDTREGASFRDVFFEIYNNSNEVIYADELYFGLVYGRTRTSVKSYTLTNGQYDWSESLNQTKGDKSNSDYSYADFICKIAGTGNQHPINPGQSIVVAGTAINHKQPLTVNDKTYSVDKPELTIDLSNADFEVNFTDYLTNLGKTGLATDIDNPSVANVEIVYNNYLRELILDPMGRDSFIIFRTEDFSLFEKVTTPDTRTVTSKTKFYTQIPNSLIIDGVEVVRENPTRAVPRRLDTSIDGGQIFVPKGPYSSQSIIRKVSQTFGGRRVLQDTNNSNDDFIVLDTPLPGGWN